MSVDTKQANYWVLEDSEGNPRTCIAKSEFSAMCVKTHIISSGTTLYVVSITLKSGATVSSISYEKYDQALFVLKKLYESL